MRYKFWQFDFFGEPLESLGKVAFVLGILAPFAAGAIWRVYDQRNIPGVIGGAANRVFGATVEETRPEVKRLVGARDAFDLGGRNQANPRR